MKNEFGNPITSIGGKVIWAYQGELEIIYLGNNYLLEGKKLTKIKSFLGIEKDSDFLGIYEIQDRKNKKLLGCFGERRNQVNYQPIEEFDDYDFQIFVLRNKKVKTVYLCLGMMEMWLVNKKDLPKEYEIRTQDWQPKK